MHKRGLALFMTIVLVLGCTSAVFADDEALNAKELGFITDIQYQNRTDNITKEEFCEIIDKLAKECSVELEETQISFEDTDSSAVARLYSAGIINGETDNYFGADKYLDRETLCTIVTRFIDKAYEDADTSTHREYVFDDNSTISWWAKDSVDYLYHMGIVKGVADNVISPKSTTTLEQAANVALRIYNEKDSFNAEQKDFSKREFKWTIKPQYDGIGANTWFACGLCAVSKDKKYGYIDTNGNTVVPFEYDMAYPFSDGMARVEKDGKYGYVNKSGKLVIPCMYDESGDFAHGLVNVSKDGKFGFLNAAGEIVIPFVYDYAYNFSDGMAPVKKDGKYGYIDKNNNIVIDFKFDWASAFSEDMARAANGGQFAFIDRTGKNLCDFTYDYAWDFSDGVAVVFDVDRYGVIDRNMNMVVPFGVYRPIGSASNGALKVHPHTVWEGAWSFIDTNGELILSFEKSAFHNVEDFHEGLAPGAWHSNTTDRVYRTYINKNTDSVLPYREWYSQYGGAIDDNFFYTNRFSEGMAALVTQDGKMGFVTNPLFE